MEEKSISKQIWEIDEIKRFRQRNIKIHLKFLSLLYSSLSKFISHCNEFINVSLKFKEIFVIILLIIWKYIIMYIVQISQSVLDIIKKYLLWNIKAERGLSFYWRNSSFPRKIKLNEFVQKFFFSFLNFLWYNTIYFYFILFFLWFQLIYKQWSI